MLRHAQKSKVWVSGQESDLHKAYVFVFLFFYIFAFSFSPFLIVLLQWLTFYWACSRLKNFWESFSQTSNFYHAVKLHVIAGNFAESFSLRFLSNFLCIFKVPLGIIEKIFFSCRTWVQVKPILLKGDYQKWNKGQCSSQPAGIRINGLKRQGLPLDLCFLLWVELIILPERNKTTGLNIFFQKGWWSLNSVLLNIVQSTVHNMIRFNYTWCLYTINSHEFSQYCWKL